jgi:hypothetical protein
MFGNREWGAPHKRSLCGLDSGQPMPDGNGGVIVPGIKGYAEFMPPANPGPSSQALLFRTAGAPLPAPELNFADTLLGEDNSIYSSGANPYGDGGTVVAYDSAGNQKWSWHSPDAPTLSTVMADGSVVVQSNGRPPPPLPRDRTRPLKWSSKPCLIWPSPVSRVTYSS